MLKHVGDNDGFFLAGCRRKIRCPGDEGLQRLHDGRFVFGGAGQGFVDQALDRRQELPVVSLRDLRRVFVYRIGIGAGCGLALGVLRSPIIRELADHSQSDHRIRRRSGNFIFNDGPKAILLSSAEWISEIKKDRRHVDRAARTAKRSFIDAASRKHYLCDA